jgi:hypothetical protein
MRLSKVILFFTLVTFILPGCQSVRENISMKKKSNTNEFLIEKKDPLVLPPSYEKLPIPQDQVSVKKNEDKKIDLSKVLKKTNKPKNIDQNKSLEKSISNILKKD